MANFNRADSPYVNTPVKDFYLDIWTNIEIPKSANDELFILTPKYHERPDLLAHDRFGTTRLWWIFARYNMDTLIDPIKDFKSGLEIRIPALKNIGRLV